MSTRNGATNDDGYASLRDLQDARPPETDVTWRGHRFRIRPLSSGDVDRISYESRIGGAYDALRDTTCTTALGLVKPDVGAGDDLNAAILIVQGFQPTLRSHLAASVVALTWGTKLPDDPGVAPVSEPASEPSTV